MSWLDLSNISNKFKQTYMTGFLDISGNLIVRNGSLTVGNSYHSNIISINGNFQYLTVKNISTNGNFIALDASFRTIYSNIVSKNIIVQDISINGNLYVNNFDVSINQLNYNTLGMQNLTVNNTSTLNNIIAGNIGFGKSPNYTLDMTTNNFSLPNYGNIWNLTSTFPMLSNIQNTILPCLLYTSDAADE